MPKTPPDTDSEPRIDDDLLSFDEDLDVAPPETPRRPARSSDPLPGDEQRHDVDSSDSASSDSASSDSASSDSASSDSASSDSASSDSASSDSPSSDSPVTDSAVTGSPPIDPAPSDPASSDPASSDPGPDGDDLDRAAGAGAVAGAGAAVGVSDRYRSWRVDGYLKRQERQRVRDEKWSRRYRKRRHRILPRTVIGTVLLLVALAVGAAFAGTVLYTWYDFRLKETQESVEQFTTEFESRFQEASAQITRQREEAEASIEEKLVPLRELTEESTSTTELAADIAPSVFFVRTLDEDGRSAAGTAFVVGSDSNKSYLVTSYEVVKASTREPGPTITLTATDREIEATLWQWEESTDMAVLTVDDPDLPVLPWASQELARNPIGTRIYAGGGLGSQGASVSPGLVIDVSAVGLQHTAAVGTAYRGGPLLTSNGEVLGMVSVDYAPLNFEPGAVTFAPNIVAACNGLLDCTGRIPTLENTEEDAEGEGEEDGEGEPADETDTEG